MPTIPDIRNELWEEKDLIEQEKNCSNNTALDQTDIITDTRSDSTPNQCEDIGEEKRCGIYKILNKINQKVYFGQSRDIELRFKRHKNDLRGNKHQNIHLQRAWNKYGENNFSFEIYSLHPADKLDSAEQLILDLARKNKRKYYNMGYDANAPKLGLKFSKKSKEKMSKSAKLRFKKYPWLRDQIYNNKERNRKISLSKKGNKNYNFGKKLTSKDTIKKLSIATKGHNNPFFDHKIYRFSHPEYGIVSSTQYDLYTKYNLSKSHVGHIIKGTRKSHHNWKVVNE